LVEEKRGDKAAKSCERKLIKEVKLGEIWGVSSGPPKGPSSIEVGWLYWYWYSSGSEYKV